MLTDTETRKLIGLVANTLAPFADIAEQPKRDECIMRRLKRLMGVHDDKHAT